MRTGFLRVKERNDKGRTVGGYVGCRWGREGARPQVKPVGF